MTPSVTAPGDTNFIVHYSHYIKWLLLILFSGRKSAFITETYSRGLCPVKEVDTGLSRAHFLSSDLAASVRVEDGRQGTAASRFVQHCDEYGLLPARQSAYRRYHSTETAVVIVYNDIVRSNDHSFFWISAQLLIPSTMTAWHPYSGPLLCCWRRVVLVPVVSIWSDADFYVWRWSQRPCYTVCCSVPQGSVLGPIEFISYTEDVVGLFERHGLSHHLFPDDKQQYTGALHRCRHRISSCVRDLQERCASRRLQLNPSKTQLIWFVSRSSLSRRRPEDRTLARPSWNRLTLCATSASCMIASWPWSDMSARRSVPASTIYAGYGNSVVTWTSIPWSSWCLLSSSVDSTTAMQFCTGYLNQPSALCNECRTPMLGSSLV